MSQLTATAPLAAADLPDLGDTVAIWAHPDDETYLGGGTMAALREAGHRVVCVTATRRRARRSAPACGPARPPHP